MITQYGTSYSHQALQPLLESSLPAAQRFHLTSAQYAELEAEEPRYGPTCVAPAARFALIVDDGRFDPSIDNTAATTHTDLLLVETVGDRWLVTERVRFQVAHNAKHSSRSTTVLATVIDHKARQLAPLNDQKEIAGIDAREYQRIAIVAMAFAARFQEGNVEISDYAASLSRPQRRALERAGESLDGFCVAFRSVLAGPAPKLWQPRRAAGESSMTVADDTPWWLAARTALARSNGILIAEHTP